MAALVCLLALTLVGRAGSLKAFGPQCPLPPDNANYVGGPDVRGTLDIVWGCFGVLILCTWTVQHLSVPRHTPEKVHTWLGGFRRKARQLVRKLWWMCITLVGPEYMIAKALSEQLAAHESRHAFGEPQWTTTHGHFANMRGFVLRFRAATVPRSLEPVKPTPEGQARFKLTGGDPPYELQKEKEAEVMEMRHWKEYLEQADQKRRDDRAREEKRRADDEEKRAHDDKWRPIIRKWRAHEEKTNAPNTRLSHDHATNGHASNDRAPTLPSLHDEQAPAPAHPQPPMDSPLGIQTDVAPAKVKRSSTVPAPRSPRSRASSKASLITPVTPLPRYTPVQRTPPTQLLPFQQPTPIPEVSPAPHPQSEPEIELAGPAKLWDEQGTWPLNSTQMVYVYRNNIIDFPDISVEMLSDRSKGDALVRVAAMLQITWMVIQIIARSFQGLATTLLEVTVLAFAACALVIYALLWHKPQDVAVPVYVDARAPLTRRQIIELAARSPVSSLMGHEFWVHGVAVRAMADNIWPHSAGLHVWLPSVFDVRVNPLVVGIGLGGAAFGSIHFAAWNFDDAFPTGVEQLLWRLSCIVLVGLPPLGISIYWVGTHWRKVHSASAPVVTRILKPFGYALMPIYLLARLFLMVEVFRSLPYLPPSAYQEVAWPVDIPHAS